MNNVARSTHKLFFLKNIFYNGFFSSFQVCPCEMSIIEEGDDEMAEIDRDNLDFQAGKTAKVERKYILKKVLNSAKYFYMLNQNMAKNKDVGA